MEKFPELHFTKEMIERKIEERKKKCKYHHQEKKEEIPLLPLCAKCPKEDHEQIYFCRCESRNIEVAKRLRALGKGKWPQDHIMCGCPACGDCYCEK